MKHVSLMDINRISPVWVYAVAFYAGFKFVMDGTIAEPQRLFTYVEDDGGAFMCL